MKERVWIVEQVEYDNRYGLGVEKVWDKMYFPNRDEACAYANRNVDGLKANHGYVVSEVHEDGYVFFAEYRK
jgi:hypothetical protein